MAIIDIGDDAEIIPPHVMGVDPGATGAWALVSDGWATVHDCPVFSGILSESGRVLLRRAQPGLVCAYVEFAASRPGQGVRSMFNFGMNYGAWLGVLSYEGVRVELVTAGVWKKYFGLTRDKDESLAKALEIFPTMAKELARKKDHGRAEALLIAEYGRRKEGGIL